MYRAANKSPSKAKVQIHNCVFLVFLIFFSLIPYLIRLIRENRDAVTIMSTNLKHQDDIGFVTVLLQQSPVLKIEQISRLTAIDNSWAKWSEIRFQDKIHVQLFAAIPFDCINCSMALSNPSLAGFSALEILKISAPISNISAYLGTAVSNPFYNLVQSLLSLMKIQNDQRRWLFLANDHSFVVLPNLVKFLVHYDADLLIYTGNRLAIGTRKSILHFASGGAGAVLSVSCIRLVSIIWTALQFHLVTIAAVSPLSRAADESCADFQEIAITAARNIVEGTPEMIKLQATADGSCVLQQVLRWSNTIARGSGFSTAINISLSSKVAVALYPTVIGQRRGKNEISFELELYQEHSPVVRVDSDTLRRNCMAKDKWSLDNPGIILSMCLTVALHIPFTPSVSVRASAVAGMPSTVELFNVYGPMRMVMDDIDDWYTKAKQLVSQDVLKTGSPPVKNNSTSREVISFHYVNQLEAGLLYRLLASRWGRERREEGSSRLTVEEVRRLWPSTNAEAGPYSRRLQTDLEARKLLLFLEAIEII